MRRSHLDHLIDETARKLTAVETPARIRAAVRGRITHADRAWIRWPAWQTAALAAATLGVAALGWMLAPERRSEPDSGEWRRPPIAAAPPAIERQRPSPSEAVAPAAAPAYREVAAVSSPLRAPVPIVVQPIAVEPLGAPSALQPELVEIQLLEIPMPLRAERIEVEPLVIE